MAFCWYIADYIFCSDIILKPNLTYEGVLGTSPKCIWLKIYFGNSFAYLQATILYLMILVELLH